MTPTLYQFKLAIPGKDDGFWACRDDLSLIFSSAKNGRHGKANAVAVYVALCRLAADMHSATFRARPWDIRKQCVAIEESAIVRALRELSRLGIIRLKAKDSLGFVTISLERCHL